MASKIAMNTDMVNKNQETLFSKVEFPYVVPLEDLKHIHLLDIYLLHIQTYVYSVHKNSKCTVSKRQQ